MEKEYTTVVVDAMGGDNAPDAMIQGAVDAITKNAAVQVILVGREEVIAPKLEAYTFDKARIRIVNASEAVSYTHLDVYKRQVQCWSMIFCTKAIG